MLLDEPTTGLDPQARHVLWDRLYRLKERGVDARPHDALHGRGRAALRPARDHGPREIVAEGSPATLIERLVEREVVELRFGATATTVAHARRHRRPRRGAPDRIVICTDNGDAVVDHVTLAGSIPIRRSCGARPSKTSSSGSPAGR